MSLETLHLSLQPCDPAHILVLIEEPERFNQATGLPAASGLREMFAGDDVSAEWLARLRASGGPDPWRHGFFVVHRDVGAVIGMAAFKGPPDSNGTVEIAYGIAPRFEGQGFATEAAGALTAFAFDTPTVELVIAHTLPAANASTRVLTKCGFRFVGDVVDPEDGPVWRWERIRMG